MSFRLPPMDEREVERKFEAGDLLTANEAAVVMTRLARKRYEVAVFSDDAGHAVIPAAQCDEMQVRMRRVDYAVIRLSPAEGKKLVGMLRENPAWS